MNDIATKLRHHAVTLRTNSVAIADLIPLLQQAADALDQQAALARQAALQSMIEEAEKLGLYDEAAQQAEQQTVLEGWKLVPAIPTPEMIHAAQDALESYPFEGNIRRHYRAMLAAAPQAEQQDERDLAINAETCAICGEGKALLVRSCSYCGSLYAGSAEMRENQKQAWQAPAVAQAQDDARDAARWRAAVSQPWIITSMPDGGGYKWSISFYDVKLTPEQVEPEDLVAAAMPVSDVPVQGNEQ